jgi:hypothetical protein
MKKLFLSAILSICSLFSICGQMKETIEITAANRLVEPVFEKTIKPENIVELKSSLKNTTGKPSSYLWAISGSKGKDWDFVSGSGKDLAFISELPSGLNPSIKVAFKRLGNYTVTLTVIFNKNLDNESELETEVEDYITVRSVFPELASLYAQKPKPNYEKLVLRASDYTVKPKYSSDPTPYLFLAKGLYGLVKEGNSDPKFEDALEECISSLQSAVELDLNGVLNDVEHQNFINEVESYLLREYLEVQLDGKPIELGEAIDLYIQTTLNPIAINFLDAYCKYQSKNIKGANLIWANEIPKLLKYERIEVDGNYTNSFINELGKTIHMTESDITVLKYGIMYSASILNTRDQDPNKTACPILRKVDPWFQFEKDFRDLFEGLPFSSCTKK